MVNLFQWGKFTSTSGLELDFKIECEALTDDDWECIANIINNKFSSFQKVYGVPTGGEKLAKKLEKFATNDPEDPVLLVDDVWTTGKSMNKLLDNLKLIENGIDWFGVVVFNRGGILDWEVESIFELIT